MASTTQTPHLDVNRRHDFVLLFDVADGNPNGNPDAGNMPRTDYETGHGLVTDVAVKRKVRDYVDVARGGEERFKIYVQRESYLTDTRARVFGNQKLERDKARQWMCSQFYDIRTFGAVMGMKQHNAGQVRGPIQLGFARSIDPIFPMDIGISRVALENPGERVQDDGGDAEAPTHGTFGSKWVVPYGLYRAHGSFNPHFAAQSGADKEDLGLFWQALQMMWDVDRSSARGMMACRGLYVFSHESSLGNAPAASLFDRVVVRRREGVETPRTFADYEVTVSEDQFPSGVELTRLAG